jgi:hypothetical protein
MPNDPDFMSKTVYAYIHSDSFVTSLKLTQQICGKFQNKA